MNVSIRVESVRAERFNFDPVPGLKIEVSMVFSKPTKQGDEWSVPFVVKLETTPPIASVNVRGVCRVALSPSDTELSKELESGRVPLPILSLVYSYTLPLIALLSRELGLPPPCPPPVQAPKPEQKLDYRV